MTTACIVVACFLAGSLALDPTTGRMRGDGGLLRDMLITSRIWTIVRGAVILGALALGMFGEGA